MQLPRLMEGSQRGHGADRLADPAQKAFFALLLPARRIAEGGAAVRTGPQPAVGRPKRVEGVFSTTIPGIESLSVSGCGAEVDAGSSSGASRPRRHAGRPDRGARGRLDGYGRHRDRPGADTGDGGDTQPDALHSGRFAARRLGLDINRRARPANRPSPRAARS